MRYTLAKEFIYIPKTKGNDKNSEPIKFKLKSLNCIERESLFETSIDENGKPIVNINRIKAFKLGVLEIENLEVNGNTIKTADEFLNLQDVLFYEMSLEVSIQIAQKRTIEEIKNSV